MTIPPPAPYQPAQSGQAGMPSPAQSWQPKVARPPLSERAKRGARWAGIVGFNLLSLGWVLVLIPAALTMFAALLTFLLGQVERYPQAGSDDFGELRSFVETLNIGVWIVPLLIVALAGVVIWALGIVLSGQILKSHGVNRPWGVTWAATGIAIVGGWFFSSGAGVIAQLFSALIGVGNTPFWTVFVVAGAIWLVVAVIVNSVTGWLAWWWMAHAMRSSRPAA